MSDLAQVALQPNPFQTEAAPANPQAQFLADSAEGFFGPKSDHMAPTAEAFFGPRPDPGLASRVMGFLSNHLLPDPGTLLGGEPVKLPKPGEPHPSVISPVIDAAVRGFGADRAGLSPETEKWFRDAGIFNDWQKQDEELTSALNEAAVRSSGVPFGSVANGLYRVYEARGLVPALRYLAEGEIRTTAETADTLMRGLGAGFVGGQEAVNQALGGGPLARDIAALPEAFQGSPHPLGLPNLSDARALDVIGTGEAGWRSGVDNAAREALSPTGRSTPTERVLRPAEPPVEQPVEAAAGEATAETAPPSPDIHAIARQIAPQVFDEFDALAARKETFRNWIDELAAQRERGSSPEIADLDKEIDSLREQRLAAARGDRADLANQITALEDKRAELADALPKAGDTPEMARVRRDMQETDYRMRDLAPDVSDAYRRAEAGEAPGNPGETSIEATPAAIPPSEPVATAPETTSNPPQPPETPATTRPAGPPLEGGIASDVAKQLVAAGRPAEEADAAGALIQAHYEARAARFHGEKGSAEDMYRAEAPNVVRGRQRVPEMAQEGGTLEQVRRGKIHLATDVAKATITLFRDADASTFIHETGHHWLDELMRDAADERAPADLAADAKTVRDWLGVNDGADIPRKAHEKFARGFERYMMEGHAPSAGLARVFDQFKQWLTAIYERVARLRAPINDDIRAVFDRMLAAPEDRAVIAPEREPAKAFADIHEADIDATPPEHAIPVADTLEAERDRVAAEAPPEIQSGRPDRSARSEDRGPERGNSALDRGGDAGQPQPGTAGDGAQPGEVSAGGNEAAPQGAGVAEGAGPTAGSTTTAPSGPNAAFERAPESGVIDKAGNIRLELLNTPEDVNTVLRQAAAENNEFMGERRGVISDAEAIRLADALGMDPAKLNRRKIGEAFNAEEIIAARKLLIQSATTVRDAMRKAATGSDAEVLAYAKAKAQHLMIQGQVSGITAEAGRALRAFREINMMEGAQEAKDLGQFLLKKATGRDLFQLREEAQLGLSLKTPRELAQFVRDTSNPRLIDKIREVWMNALLSNPMTHEANMIGNAITALYTVPETAAAAVVGRVRQLLPGADAARVEMGEAGERLFGISRGSMEGVRAGWELLKNEDLTDLHTKVDAQRFQAIGGTAGKIVRMPGRLLGAEDKVFKGIAYRQEINALAYRQATKEGLNGDGFSTRVAQLVNDPPEAMIEAATEHADYQTYNNKLGSVGNAALHFANSHPAIRFIVPFIRTPLNILKYSAERSPFGLLMKDVRDNLAGKNGAIARDTQIARVALGTAVSTTAAFLAMQGLITGGGPSDPRKRAALRMTGWQPYSVKIGEGYYSFSRLDPFSTLLGVSADMYEVQHYALESERESIAKLIFGSISKNLVSKTWLKGPSDLIQAVTDPDRYGQSYIKGFAGTVIPAGVAQIARWHDPYMREAHSIIEGIKSRIPGVSETLYPRRDVWGEPIPQDDSFLPIAHSRVNNDPANQALVRLGYAPEKLQRKVRGVELTEDQYDGMARIAGRSAKMRVDALARMPGFQTLPDGAQREAISKAITESREMARSIVMMQNPEIIAKALENKKAQITGAKH